MKGMDFDYRIVALILFLLLLAFLVYFVMAWTGKVDDTTYLLTVAGGLG